MVGHIATTAAVDGGCAGTDRGDFSRGQFGGGNAGTLGLGSGVVGRCAAAAARRLGAVDVGFEGAADALKVFEFLCTSGGLDM